MSLFGIQVSWIDLLILGLLMVGVLRGRKRGMSQELLDMLKWFLIVGVAAFAYEPGGRILAQTAVMGLFYSYISVYALVLLLILFSFAMIRKQTGDKLVGSDVFGGAEYYLGMMAGAFRYGCMLLVIMAFLNARYFSPQEIYAQEHFQKENFGETYFPTLAAAQNCVFTKSMTGRFVKHYLSAILIRPTSPKDNVPRGHKNVFSRHQRDLNDVLAK